MTTAVPSSLPGNDAGDGEVARDDHGELCGLPTAAVVVDDVLDHRQRGHHVVIGDAARSLLAEGEGEQIAGQLAAAAAPRARRVPYRPPDSVSA